MGPGPTGVIGATIAVVAIFLPSFLLVWGVLPFWDAVRGRDGVRRALTGVNAAVVGLLLAALITPVWTSAVQTPLDALLAAGAGALLVVLKLPPIAVVVATAVATELLARVT
jgi:chromate transporter